MSGNVGLARLTATDRLGGRLLLVRGVPQGEVAAALKVPAGSVGALRRGLGKVPSEDRCRWALDQELGTGSDAVWSHMRRVAILQLVRRAAGLAADPAHARLCRVVEDLGEEQLAGRLPQGEAADA